MAYLALGTTVTQAGETFEENAYRELEEELGVKGVPMEHLFTFYYEVIVGKGSSISSSTALVPGMLGVLNS